MRKITLEQTNQRKRRFTFLNSVTIGVTVVLAFLQLLLSNHLAGFGRELAVLAEEEKALFHENELLKKEIAKDRSIATISQKAQALSLGSVTPSNLLVIEEQESVAMSPAHEF